MRIDSVEDVVAYQLCTGCGICAYLNPARHYMGDSFEHGRRPFIRAASGTGEAGVLKACPGIGLKHPTGWERDQGLIDSLKKGWGPVHGVWEGYAGDPAIRMAGSSGGAASALALFGMEREGMAGVLHTAASDEASYLNCTVMSRSRDELLARTGSRYAPASPGEGLDRIEQAGGRCVFIGKPCDVAGLQAARKLRPELGDKIGLAIAFFCAGVPSTQGTVDLLKRVGVRQAEDVTYLRYRGNGWPGMWTVRTRDDGEVEEERRLTYADSWGFLQRYRQWRCYICPDHTGEFADVAVGDPWYRDVKQDDPGRSLIVARTKRGAEMIRAAAAAGYLVVESEDASLLPRSQRNLLTTRASLWGRLAVLKVLGAAVPRYEGFSLFHLWFTELSLAEKIRSFTATAKRVFVKRLRVRISPSEWKRGSRVVDS